MSDRISGRADRADRVIAGGFLLLGAFLGGSWSLLRPPRADAGAAAAATIGHAARGRAERLVARIGDGRARVVDVFAGPDDLEGLVVEAAGSRFIGWLTPRTDNLIVGALFDSAGRNQSQAELMTHDAAAPPAGDRRRTPAPEAPVDSQPQLGGAQLQRALSEAASFVEGEAGPIVSAFIDLNCTFCARLYDESRSMIGRGKLRMRWIPVAVIGPDSLERAAALLQARDRMRALAAAHAHLLAPVEAALPLREAIAANNALLSALTSGRAATPVLLVERADGSFAATAGVPDDLTAFAALSSSRPDADRRNEPDTPRLGS